MMDSLWTRKFAVVIAAAALCAAVAGYVSESQGATPKKSASQMRYYGGPKSPMWRGWSPMHAGEQAQAAKEQVLRVLSEDFTCQTNNQKRILEEAAVFRRSRQRYCLC